MLDNLLFFTNNLENHRKFNQKQQKPTKRERVDTISTTNGTRNPPPCLRHLWSVPEVLLASAGPGLALHGLPQVSRRARAGCRGNPAPQLNYSGWGRVLRMTVFSSFCSVIFWATILIAFWGVLDPSWELFLNIFRLKKPVTFPIDLSDLIFIDFGAPKPPELSSRVYETLKLKRHVFHF